MRSSVVNHRGLQAPLHQHSPTANSPPTTDEPKQEPIDLRKRMSWYSESKLLIEQAILSTRNPNAFLRFGLNFSCRGATFSKGKENKHRPIGWVEHETRVARMHDTPDRLYERVLVLRSEE